MLFLFLVECDTFFPLTFTRNWKCYQAKTQMVDHSLSNNKNGFSSDLHGSSCVRLPASTHSPGILLRRTDELSRWMSPSHQRNKKTFQEHKDLSRCVPILEKVITFCLIWNICYSLDVSMYLIISFNAPADSQKLQLPVCVMWHRVMSEHAWLTEEILAVLILPTETVTVPAQRPQGSLRLNHQTHTYFPLWCVKLLGALLSLEKPKQCN